MKRTLRRQRILFLCLFSLCVFAPVVFVARRSKYISSSGSKEFIDGFPAIKYRSDYLKLDSVEQEGGKILKEPKLVFYEDKGVHSVVSYRSSEKIHDGSDTSTAIADSSERNGTISGRTMDDQREGKTSTSREKEKSSQATHQDTKLLHTQPRNSTDRKVKQMKDQLIRAKAYLAFAPPGSNSHFVKELKRQLKELERAMGGETTKDSSLSKSALQKSKSMEVLLVRASRIYPHCSSMASKLRAMTYNAEEQVQAQKDQAAYLLHLAARTTPKGLHCLTMQLTSEYFTLPPEERKFPNQQNIHSQNLYHYAVFSDNILATSVVVNSTISSAMVPEEVVFHIVTDSLNFPAMSMWFLLNPPAKGSINIRSTEDFEWLSKKYNATLQKNYHDPRFSSALNHLRFYLPDVFPSLDKILLLDHDVVVQRDLTSLWDMDMGGKVNAAVETCNEGEGSYRRMSSLVNFSDPFVSGRFDPNKCTWAFGMNMFDLQRWRRKNLTNLYTRYLKLGEKRQLWRAGSLPLGWVTFYNQTVAIDRRWHVLGLGYNPNVARSQIEDAAVIHYDGVMKPWLEIGIEKYKGHWSKHVIYDHPYLQQCNIHP